MDGGARLGDQGEAVQGRKIGEREPPRAALGVKGGPADQGQCVKRKGGGGPKKRGVIGGDSIYQAEMACQPCGDDLVMLGLGPRWHVIFGVKQLPHIGVQRVGQKEQPAQEGGAGGRAGGGR